VLKVQTCIDGTRRLGEIQLQLHEENQRSDSEILSVGSKNRAVGGKVYKAKQCVSDREFCKRYLKRNEDVVDFAVVKLQLRRSIENQISPPKETRAEGVERMHHTLSLEVRDAQGRHWRCTKEERSCMADTGRYYHMASVLRNFEPVCERAAKVSAHVKALYETGAAPPGMAVAPIPVLKGMSEGVTVESISLEAANDMKCDLDSLLDDFDWDVEEIEWNDLTIMVEASVEPSPCIVMEALESHGVSLLGQ